MIDTSLFWQIILLLVAFYLYTMIAKKFSIFDIPNNRSSHTNQVLRGGGVIFYIAIMLYQVTFTVPNPFFTSGLTLLVAVSFVDDIRSVSPLIRTICQLAAVILLFMELPVDLTDWWFIGLLILAVGILNAYNFMDGINGITGIYSLVFLGSMLYLGPILELDYTHLSIIVIVAIGIFGFYNFRVQAVIFAGDVGSMSIGFLILFLLSTMIFKTNDPSFLLMLAVYGTDAVWTIILRLVRKENIFKAHRTHLYQYLANHKKWPQMKISLIYGIIQTVINIIIVCNYLFFNWSWQIFMLIILIPLSAVYLITKGSVFKLLPR